MFLMSLSRKIVGEISKKRGRFIISLFKEKYIKGKILDIGSSDLKSFDEYDVVYLDIKNINGLKNFVQCDLNKQRIPFEDNTFDVVIASHVLEHLKSPYLVLEECKRVLKKGGILIVGLPNPHYFSTSQKKKKYHINMICHITMKQILKSLGFKIIDFRSNWLIFENNFFGQIYQILPMYFKTDYWYVAKK